MITGVTKQRTLPSEKGPRIDTIDEEDGEGEEESLKVSCENVHKLTHAYLGHFLEIKRTYQTQVNRKAN